MKKILSANVLLLVFFAFLTAPSTTLAITPITIQVETGAQIDKARVVVRTVNDGQLVIVSQVLDTIFQFTAEPMSSLVIYYAVASDDFFMVTGIGDSVVEISAENLGEGDFVVINTTEPDGCTTLSLAECRVQSDFIAEQSLSISLDEKAPVPEVKSSLLDKALGFFLGLIGTNDTATSTDTVTTETTNTNLLANVISAIDNTASTTADNSSVATSTEEQTAQVIVSDTNAASITSPLSDETATSTTPETQTATSSVSGDTNTNGTTTATF